MTDGEITEGWTLSDRFRGTLASASPGLYAVFVSDGVEHKPGTAALVSGMGAGVLRFPAVLVPEGAMPPGYPFVEFGEFHGDDEHADAAGPSYRDPTTERAVHMRRSSAHARHTRSPKQEARGLAAATPDGSDDATLAAPAGSPPAMARDPQGQLHDYAAAAMSAARHSLAV